MPWSPFFILIRQRASCQEFALCILLITWSSFDLTQVWQGQDSIWRHGTNIQDVSWEFQFKCYYTSGVRLINWYHSNSNLLESTSASNLHGQEFDYLGYFAGAGEITKHMLASKYRAVRLDLFWTSWTSHQKVQTRPTTWISTNLLGMRFYGWKEFRWFFLLWHFDTKKHGT